MSGISDFQFCDWLARRPGISRGEAEAKQAQVDAIVKAERDRLDRLHFGCVRDTDPRPSWVRDRLKGHDA